jgi:hypothetical protein
LSNEVIPLATLPVALVVMDFDIEVGEIQRFMTLNFISVDISKALVGTPKTHSWSTHHHQMSPPLHVNTKKASD